MTVTDAPCYCVSCFLLLTRPQSGSSLALFPSMPLEDFLLGSNPIPPHQPSSSLLVPPEPLIPTPSTAMHRQPSLPALLRAASGRLGTPVLGVGTPGMPGLVGSGTPILIPSTGAPHGPVGGVPQQPGTGLIHANSMALIAAAFESLSSGVSMERPSLFPSLPSLPVLPSMQLPDAGAQQGRLGAFSAVQRGSGDTALVQQQGRLVPVATATAATAATAPHDPHRLAPAGAEDGATAKGADTDAPQLKSELLRPTAQQRLSPAKPTSSTHGPTARLGNVNPAAPEASNAVAAGQLPGSSPASPAAAAQGDSPPNQPQHKRQRRIPPHHQHAVTQYPPPEEVAMHESAVVTAARVQPPQDVDVARGNMIITRMQSPFAAAPSPPPEPQPPLVLQPPVVPQLPTVPQPPAVSQLPGQPPRQVPVDAGASPTAPGPQGVGLAATNLAALQAMARAKARAKRAEDKATAPLPTGLAGRTLSQLERIAAGEEVVGDRAVGGNEGDGAEAEAGRAEEDAAAAAAAMAAAAAAAATAATAAGNVSGTPATSAATSRGSLPGQQVEPGGGAGGGGKRRGKRAAPSSVVKEEEDEDELKEDELKV